jgi:methylmalonyl-CoA mutase cobalamin-binding subunit
MKSAGHEVNAAMTASPPERAARPLAIGAVERDVGLPGETLRIWERRYGFPQPVRDAAGRRAYPPEQVRKLRLLRRLLAEGHRPGRIVPLPVEALAALAAPIEAGRSPPDDAAAVLAHLRAADVEGLRRLLEAALRRHGLRGFVADVAPSLLAAVGLAWAAGEIAVHHEHLFSHEFAGVVRAALADAATMLERGAAPRVLMTTFPGEAHALGLLLAEAMLALEGCRPICLGVETPAPEIAAAAQAHDADIVALSISASYPQRHVRGGLAELRRLTGPATQVWVGGAGVGSLRGLPGVVRLRALDQIAPAVAAWRKARAAA